MSTVQSHRTTLDDIKANTTLYKDHLKRIQMVVTEGDSLQAACEDFCNGVTNYLLDTAYKGICMEIDGDFIRQVVLSVYGVGLRRKEIDFYNKIYGLIIQGISECEELTNFERRALELEVGERLTATALVKAMEEEFGVKKSFVYNAKANAYAAIADYVDERISKSERAMIPALRCGLRQECKRTPPAPHETRPELITHINA